ncbi:MAG: response regulator [Methanoregula sp.]
MISVLHVDDEPDLLELCRIFLEQTGEFRVDTAESAKDALVQISKTPYDAIIADYLMPEIDGISLLQSIRQRDQDIPFILFTGRGREDVVIEALNNGADFYLRKDGDPQARFGELVQKVRQAVNKRRAERDLRSRERQYRSIIDHVQDMLYRTDMEGKITMISPAGAKRAGYSSAAEMTGLNLDQTLYADPLERKKFLAVLAREGSVYEYPLVFKDRKGHRFPVIASSHYFFDSQGHVLGVEGIVHDVTHLRRKEDALKEANRKLSLLNSVTRHDVANQLTVLRGYAHLAMMKNPDPVISDFLQKIDAAAATIGRQIEFSKEYQELGVVAPGWFSLDDIFAKNKPGDILFSSSCTGTEIFADPMLEKVFANLFSNAIVHGERVSRITVRCEPKGDDLQITVEDNGVGIPLDVKQNIFRKGFGKNTGFGLFLAREILAITGISIHETGKHGSGARFEITVPKNGFRCCRDPGSRHA